MICPNCGTAVYEHESFCTNCGSSVQAATSATQAFAPGPRNQPLSPTTSQPLSSQRFDQPHETPAVSPIAKNTDSFQEIPRKPVSTKLLGFVALAVALSLIAAGGGYLLQKKYFSRSLSAGTAEGAPISPTPGSSVPPVSEPQADIPVSREAAANSDAPGADADQYAAATPLEPQPAPAITAPVKELPAAKPSLASRPQSNLNSGSSRPPAPSPSATNSPARPPATSTPVASPEPSPAASSAAAANTSQGSSSNRPPASAVSSPPIPAPAAPSNSTPNPQIAQSAPQPPPETTELPHRAPPGTRILNPTGTASAPPKPNSPPAPGAPSALPGSKLPQPDRAPADEGVIYWTGRLEKNKTITVEGVKSTLGDVSGAEFPGSAIDVWLPSPAVALVERPNPQNGWKRVVFRCLRNTDRNVTINIQWKRLR